MKKIKQFDQLYLIAFLIPFFILGVFYAVGGYFPFGNKTVLTWDMYQQYGNFFSWMNRVLKQESMDTVWYSFSLSLGGATIGLIGYYLLSPFNLILLPFSTEWLPVGIQLVTMLKISCGGVTMYYYLKKRFDIRGYATVLFAVMYALMGYTVVYQQNIMWLDGVILLPVILLHIYYLVMGRKWKLYPFWIAIAIITDFYIAYMVILFAFIYFLLEYVINVQGKNFRLWFWRLLQFAGATLLGVGLSGIVFLPVIYEIFNIGRGSAGGILDSISSILTIDSKIWMFPLKQLVGAYDQQQLIHGLPNIYVSLLCVPFLGLYFVDVRNSGKERMAWGLAVLLLFFSFASVGLNQIWQGFTYASGCNYRYSFCMSFLWIAIGYQQYLKIWRSGKICHPSVWSILGAAGAGVWIGIVVWKQYKDQMVEFSSIKKWMCTALFLMCGLLGVWILRKRKQYLFYVSVTIVMCAELVLNLYWCAEDFEYQGLQEYQEYVTSVEKVYKELQEENEGIFFRMESELRDPLNDAMLLGYPSITHYSSTVRNEVAQYALENHILADGFGRQATLFRDYNISTEQLGRYAVKYLLTYRLPQDGDMDGWVIKQESPFYILENMDFKPLCFLSTKTGTEHIKIQVKNSAHIKVEVSELQENGNILMTSIPDRRGWTITVDGVKVEPEDEDLFIRVALPQGDHEIMMKYHQPMLGIGASVSLLSVLLYIAGWWRKRRI